MAENFTQSSHPSRTDLTLLLHTAGRRKKMRPHTLAITLAAMAAALLAPLPAQTLDVQLQRTIEKETVTGDLKTAIEEYKKIVARAGSDRAVAAKALVHMAEAYQKMGDSEARKIYQRVLREFADQKEPVAFARARLARSAAAPGVGIAARQVWTGPKVDTLGTVSPDGRVLSFVDWSTGDLALHDLTTGQDRRLTNKGTWNDSVEFAEESAISRDGRQLAYAWFNKDFFYEVRLIDLNGNAAPRVLFSNKDVEWIAPYDWSPDGKWLAVALTRMDRTAQLGLLSAADGSLRVLKSVDWRGASKMAFSPDGRFLAYDLPASDDSEQRDIYVMTTDGVRELPAVAHPANDILLGWSPAGRHLLFASDRSGRFGVWAIPIADGRPQGAAELIKPDINPGAMGLTRSGSLYYRVNVSGRDVYVTSVDFETGKVLSPPASVAQQYVGFNDSPQWSPDGKYLAYISHRDSANPNRNLLLAIRSMETGRIRELRPDLSHFFYPLWSPDGSFLLVNGADRKGRRGIYRIALQSGETTPLLIGQPQDSLAGIGWSPDGKTLYLRRFDLKSRQFVALARDMQSGEEREIVRTDAVSGFAVSRDGRWLAVAAFEKSSKSTALLLVPAQGGEPRELLRVRDAESRGLGCCGWSPDGKFLLVNKLIPDENRSELRRDPWRVSIEGGAPRKIELNGARGMQIHPDGRQAAFSMGEPKQEVWAMDNFLPLLQASK
jgi:Tol biopolymer transport system component